MVIDNQRFHAKKTLITGGLGFIGSHLAAALLRRGAEVTVVDSLLPQYGGKLYNVDNIRNKLNINISDVRDGHSLKYLLADQDYLFNLAGQTSHVDSMSDPKTDLEINAAAQLSIIEACRIHNPNIKIVYASTRQIYGRPQFLPVTESHPINPVDINGIHKWCAEGYHSLYHKVYGMKTCSLRLTNTYGPHMRVSDARQTFLGIWFKNIILGDPIEVFGDGLQLRDFNYVDDVVEAFLMAALHPESDGRVFNLGGSEVVSLIDVAEKMVHLKGGAKYKITPFPQDRKAIDIGDYYGSANLIKSSLGWTPKISLNEGLAKTLAFYEKNIKNYI